LRDQLQDLVLAQRKLFDHVQLVRRVAASDAFTERCGQRQDIWVAFLRRFRRRGLEDRVDRVSHGGIKVVDWRQGIVDVVVQFFH